MPLSISEALSDFPAILDLVEKINVFIAAEQKAVSFADKQKASEPVQEALAALVDVVKAQVAS